MKNLSQHINESLQVAESKSRMATDTDKILVTGKMFAYIDEKKVNCKKIEIETFGSFGHIEINEKDRAVIFPMFETEDYAAIKVDGKSADNMKVTLTYFADTDEFYVSDEHVYGAASASKYSNIYSKVDSIVISSKKNAMIVSDAIKSINSNTKHFK